MTETESSTLRSDLEEIAAVQKSAVNRIVGIASTLLVAFVVAAWVMSNRVERIDTMIGEKFNNMTSALERLERSISDVARNADGKYDRLELRVRDVEHRASRLETFHEAVKP